MKETIVFMDISRFSKSNYFLQLTKEITPAYVFVVKPLNAVSDANGIYLDLTNRKS